MDLFYAALIFGLLTGFHCIGMCGPIAISLPLSDQNWTSKTLGGIIYNLGRVVTYSILGGLFGLVGQGLKIAGFQQALAIVVGSIMIASVFFPLLFNKMSKGSPLFSSVEKLKMKMGLLFGKKSNSALFAIGLLNGLLPCGPVYIALGLSLASGHFLLGSLYMAVFGLGTIPIMLSLSLLGNFISGPIRLKIRKIVPTFIVLMGLWFILKGLGLGIHLISPSDNRLHVEQEPVKELKNCCK
ncbi:MAG: sulfite exporter TauE/SafE family protein [Bacteroidales bacterium]|nr:sulfite exporter TauE/SafE family protein [Bacteroidales bacterium]MCF8455087.1 sulfite exporter TauE/SafE family protein [Bacteroidales bacterium]